MACGRSKLEVYPVLCRFLAKMNGSMKLGFEPYGLIYNNQVQYLGDGVNASRET